MTKASDPPKDPAFQKRLKNLLSMKPKPHFEMKVGEKEKVYQKQRSRSLPEQTPAPCYYINAFMIAAIPKRQSATLTLMFSVTRGFIAEPSDHAGAIREGCV
jgi:hypothetical protein